MALFRKFFYRKPPDGLLEISERIYVFDSCFTIDEEKDYKIYIGSILGQLREHFLDASFLVFNFHGSEVESEISKVLSEYDVIIMDYPRHYEGCPILSMELIHHFLRSTDSWLALGQQNILLMHCDQGGWPALAFMLAALLIYRKLYTGEQRTLDMVYKQAPRELLRLLSPLNPIPSQIRYLQYVSRRNVVSDWPPSDRALTLDCVIIRHIPDFDGKGGCRPLFRIYGQDPLTDTNQTSKLLFSTPKKSKAVRLYKQAESEIVKIDINCNIQGDIVLECSSLNDDMEHEEMMFRVMFNTSFMRSNILILNRDEVDTLWDAKDHFPKDFRAEVLFSDMDAAASVVAANLSPFEEKEGLPMEAFAKVQEFFSNVDWLDSRADAALDVLHKISASHVFQEKADSPMSQGTRSSSPLQRSSPQMSKEDQKHTAVANDSRSSALLVEDNQLASPNSAMSEKVVSKNSSNVQQEQNQFIPVAESQSNSSSSIKGRTILGSPAMLQSSDTKTSGGIEENNSVLKDPVHSDQTFPAPPPTPISPIPSSFSTSAGKPPTSPLTLVPDHLTSFETPPIRCLDSVVQETGQSSTAMPPSESLTLLPPPPLTADSVDSLSSKAGFPYSLQVPVALPMPQTQDSTSKAGAWPASPLPPTTSQDSGFRAGSPLIPPPPPPPPPTTFRGVSSFRAGPPLPPPSPKQPPTLPLNGNSPIRVVPPPPLPPPLPSNNDSTKVDGPTPPLPPCSIPLPLTTLPLNENSALRAVPSPPPPTPPPLPSSAKVRTPAPPPPPPPQQSMSASLPTSLSPVPPPPLPAPSLVHKHSDSKLQNSSAAPPAPPPPAAFGKGATKAGSAPIPGPPYSSPSNTRARSPLRPLGPRSTQTKKLKPLHWLKLTRAAQGSVWAETQKSGEFSKTPDIDLSELESLFSVAAPNLDRGKSRRGLGGPKSDKVQLIDHRRAYNCEIMLSKVKIPVNELMSSLLSLDDSALDVDQVDNLIKFCPTKEEMELLKGYTGDVDKLGKTEQFLLELMKVPRVQSKLRVFSFKMGFHTQVLDLRNSLSIVNLAVDEIRNSVKLKRILQTILSLGNALNQGTARGSAVGFRLDSLLKLTETRARDNKMTLMHYLCKVVAEKSPELLDFSKELSSMEPASKIQIKFLAEEMQAITKGLEKVVQELSMSEDDGPVSEVFQKNLKEFLHVAEAKVRLLCSLYSAVGKNVDALIIYFGEDPARCQFEQVMSTLFNFTRMFNQAHDENLKQLELEKKKAEKEAAEHQKLASPRSLGHVISSPKTSRMAKYFKSSD